MGIRQRFYDESRAWNEGALNGPLGPLMRWNLLWRVLPGEVPNQGKLRLLKVSSVAQLPVAVAIVWLAWRSGFRDDGAFLWAWTAFVVGISAYNIWVAWFRKYPYGT